LPNTIKSVEKIAAQYEHDFAHSQHVAKLAVQLFDASEWLHGLGDDARDLLFYAGLLHDIGWSGGQQAHHKRAYDLIMHDPPAGLSPREVRIIANVARYHRKGLPKLSHDAFSALKPQDRELVRRLASLLRVADGLDITHRNAVSIVACTESERGIVITVKSSFNLSIELARGREKSDLFEETFGKTVEFQQEDSH